jgi:hypothetical protein
MGELIRRLILGLLIGSVVTGNAGSPAQGTLAHVERVKFQSGSHYLVVEFLDDDLVHFELSALGPGPETSQPKLGRDRRPVERPACQPFPDRRVCPGPAVVRGHRV